MVGVARNFTKLNVLIDPQGNVGSAGGDSAAAMRYTEMRMSKFTKSVYFQDYSTTTVPQMPNFDNSRTEPVYLPSSFPMFLVTGVEGIATGFTSNLPTHKLSDIYSLVESYIKNPNQTTIELTKKFRPDFPLGGTIVNESELPEIYDRGQGIIKVKATIDIEKQGGKDVLVIKDLPPSVDLKRVRTVITDDMKSKDPKDSKFLDKISDMYDESSVKVPVKFVIVPKRGVDPSLLMNLLYSHTPLMHSVGYMANVIYKGKLVESPSLSKMLEMWIEYRINFIEKRTNSDIKSISEKMYLKKALSKAHAKIEDVIKIVRNSKSEEDSIEKLKKLLKIAEREAKYIIGIRLQQIANVEKVKLDQEIIALEEDINKLVTLITDTVNIKNLILTEMKDIVKKFDTPNRMTKLSNENLSNMKDVRNFIEKDELVIGVSTDNYIYTKKVSEVRETKRNTKGSLFIPSKYKKSLKNVYTVSTHDDICIFCKDGQVIKAKGYELDAFHKPIGALLTTIGSRDIAAIVPVTVEDASKHFVFVSACGFMKRVKVSDITESKFNSFISWKPSSAYDDELVDVSLSTNSKDNVLVCLASGYAMRMQASAIAELNRSSPGRAMIALRNDKEQVVNIDVSKEGESTKVFLTCTNSRSKIVDINDIPLRSDNAGRKVAKLIMRLEEDDVMVGGLMVNEESKVLVNTSDNLTVKVDISQIREMKRSAKGTKVVNLKENDFVVSFTTGSDSELLED